MDIVRKNHANLSGQPRHVVAMAITDGVSPFEMAVPCSVFGMDRTEQLGVPWYEFRVCAVPRTPVRTSMGFTVDTEWTTAGLADADTVVVSAAGVEEIPEELVEVLRAAHERGARILSLCSGAFALAEAGLLDGHTAATHWMHAPGLAERYPLISVDPDRLYIDEGQVLTSAGTAAGIDLCLHVLRSDYGVEIANEVARELVVPPHRDGGQAQFVTAAVPAAAADAFSTTLDWAARHLDEPLTVADLAARSVMSPRTFARRFREATGTSPHQWLVRQRVAEAQRLLESTDLPVEEIAPAVGFGTAAALRQQFQRVLHTTPTGYRSTFTPPVEDEMQPQ